MKEKKWNSWLQTKKCITILIVFLCLSMMLAVWPFCFIRRNTLISSNMDKAYVETEMSLTADAPLIQTFIAQEAKLESIEFALSYENSLPTGSLQFDLYDNQGMNIKSQNINFSEIENYCFFIVEIDKWICKGAEYSFCISVAEEYDNIFKGLYAVTTEPCTAGNQTLRVGEELLDGNAITRYGYGYPLNIKNIICIWAFLIVCSLCICSWSKIQGFETKEKSRLFEICESRIVRTWKWVCKYQIPILLLEIVVVLLLTAYICCVRIVDWDEAYSLQMVTKYSFAEMFKVTSEDIHPPLYYVLLRLFSMLFGTSIFALKMLSVIFTMCTMLVGATKVRKHWGFEVAFLFILVVGLGPQFIAYSVNIRMYSLSLLFIVLSAILAFEIIQGQGKWNWCFFVLASLGGVYTHYFNVVPLVVIYGYLLMGLLLENRKQCKYFWMSCVAAVVGYLPWLGITLRTFDRAGVREEGVSIDGFDFGNLFEWAFKNNIEFSVQMPLILFVISVVLLVAERKKYTRQEKLFLAMCAMNLILSYMGCRIVTSVTARFWDNRYVFASLGLLWLFLLIICGRRSKMIFCGMSVWLFVMVASSYVIQMAKEIGADSYVDAAYEVLEQVQNEEIVMYNYNTYDVLYGAHLREQEFVFIDDVEWEKLEQNYIYLIGWGGYWFKQEVIEKYNLQVENCGTMRFEEGVAGVELYKISFCVE